MKVTIYDVAREAGLSIATVSRVINGKGGVTPKSEKKIRDAIARLGYMPDASAQGLASSLVNTIGVAMIGSVSSSYYIQFLDGAERAARERGFDLLLTSVFGTPEDFVRVVQTRHKMDGLIFPALSDYVYPFYKAGFPVCYAGHRTPWDDRRVHIYGGFSGYRKEALSLLFSKGCRRIVYFNGSLSDLLKDNTKNRDQKVIEDFVISGGLEPGMVEYITFRPDNVDAAYEQLRLRLTGKDPPDGIFVVDDKCASQVYALVMQCGFTIPGDVKIVASIQNREDGSLLRPALTAFLVNSYQMGYNAATKLIQMIQGGTPDDSLTYVPYSFVERESV